MNLTLSITIRMPMANYLMLGAFQCASPLQ